MAGSLFLLGTNHERAPISVRERLAVTKADLPQALARLAALPGVQEAYLLSTCNRTELYLVGELPQAREGAAGFLAELGRFTREELSRYTYSWAERDAVAHLFAVAAGANSMVLGDAEILGQIKASYLVAAQMETLGKTLHALLRKAVEVGKAARTQTGIGGKAASLSYAVVEVAKQALALKQARVLIVGAGTLGRLLAKILAANGVRETLFANRTLAKAQALAEEFGGRAVQFQDLDRHLEHIDLAIAVTDAPCFILHRQAIQRALRQRSRGPLLLVDMGTPRNIDDRARELEGVTLYNLDDLQGVIQNNLEARREELHQVMVIIEEKAKEFMAWRDSSSQSLTIRALSDLAETIRREELHKMEGKLSRLAPQERHTVDLLTSRILHRLLHPPITELKTAAASGDGEGLSDAVRRLFHVERTG